MSTARIIIVLVFAWLTQLACACPEATGWYRSSVTGLCYRGLLGEKYNYFEAAKRCNQLRSNLFQFQSGDTKTQFDELQTELYQSGSQFLEKSWIGLTDRAAVGQYVYLNGLRLSDIAPDIYITCPDATPNCKPANRCVFLNLNNRGSSNRQVFDGNCDADQLVPICYAPENGTDIFDQVPELGANGPIGVSLALLAAALVATGLSWQL